MTTMTFEQFREAVAALHERVCVSEPLGSLVRAMKESYVDPALAL